MNIILILINRDEYFYPQMVCRDIPMDISQIYDNIKTVGQPLKVDEVKFDFINHRL